MESKALLGGDQGSGVPSAPPPEPGTAPPPPYSQPASAQPYLPPNQGQYGAVVDQQPRPQVAGNAQVDVKPPNYMILNVFTMICCCFVCGLVGLLTANQVDTAWNKGERGEAYRHSGNAKKWGIGGIVGGCMVHVCIVLPSIVLVIIFGIIGAASYQQQY